MSESSSETSTGSNESGRRRIRFSPNVKIGLSIGAALGALILLVYLTTAGSRSGIEFSPDDFSRRSYSYNKVPFFGFHIGGGVEFRNLTPDFEQSLIAPPGLIQVRTSQPKIWDLVTGSRVPNDSHDCDASILTKYLDMYDSDGGSYWTSWNNEHPDSAKLLWPAIAELARNELYLGVPDVMKLAIDTKKDDAKRFGKALKETMAEVYIQQGISEQHVGDLEQAIAMYTKSIDSNPTFKGYSARAEMLQATGKSSRAQRDRIEADRLK